MSQISKFNEFFFLHFELFTWEMFISFVFNYLSFFFLIIASKNNTKKKESFFILEKKLIGSDLKSLRKIKEEEVKKDLTKLILQLELCPQKKHAKYFVLFFFFFYTRQIIN